MAVNMGLKFDTKTARATCGDWAAPFSFGKNGTVPAVDGHEGDSRSPLGHYALRFGLYRPDRLPRPDTPLTLHPLQADDGWCDAPNDAAYNRFIQTPYPASFEALWREDGAYDVILVMSHNDSPPQPGAGSAVFIHCRQPDHRPTLGCLALSAPDMWALLPNLRNEMRVQVV